MTLKSCYFCCAECIERQWSASLRPPPCLLHPRLLPHPLPGGLEQQDSEGQRLPHCKPITHREVGKLYQGPGNVHGCMLTTLSGAQVLLFVVHLVQIHHLGDQLNKCNNSVKLASGQKYFEGCSALSYAYSIQFCVKVIFLKGKYSWGQWQVSPFPVGSESLGEALSCQKLSPSTRGCHEVLACASK